MAGNRVIWEQWQLDYLKFNWENQTSQQLSDAIGIKRTKVREKLYELGLKKMVLEYWTEEQVEFLRENYQRHGDVELAIMFSERWHKDKGWAKQHMNKKRSQLKLLRTPEEIKAIKQRNIAIGMFSMCATNRWKTTGVTPVGERRMWENASGRQLMVIKLNAGFVHYARWLYAQIFGPPPDDHMVRLKDGNPENVTVSNLVLVTRSEHAILNSKNRDPEFNTARKLLKQIKSITKEHEKQTKRLEQSSVRSAGASE